ncbi:Mitochondrial metalloendopeptidase [Lachnellula occidentalis]|uniref:Mitochondrial metalloendopeptidase n=1 Tax=Lachnellula occidentalis TaxID=215460 RepID=A0A8H8RM22_9HELO|nr:Mitochondrial metalloendopeptidase [Lachnellula occidentalis]
MIQRFLFRAPFRASPRITTLAIPQHSAPWRPASISHNLPSIAPFHTSSGARPTPRTPPNAIHIRTPSLQSPRLESSFRRPRRPQKIIHTRFDPEHVRHAKPLLTGEQLAYVITHGWTKVVVVVGGVGSVIFYVWNLEEVPVSGRRRFNCYSESSVEAQGKMMYEKVMRDARGSILPDYDPRVKKVQRVMERLIPASGMEDTRWELHVIHSAEMNAFVMPGGKVFVYSGILPIAKTDDGLAAILGHEIAHNVARHQAEQLSSLVILAPLRWAFIFLDSAGVTAGFGRLLGDLALQFGLMMPASRKQESEADYIGLMIMAKACYDPKAAVKVWQRMEAANKSDIPQWLSTHPSNNTRIEQMAKWLPKAEAARDESGCAVTMGYAKDFQETMGGWVSFGKMI